MFRMKQEEFNVAVLESTKPVIIEFFKPETIECLLCSNPIKDLFEGRVNIKYRKMEVVDDSLTKKYKVSKLPALLFFLNGKLIGKIEGFYSDKQLDELKKMIELILPKLIKSV